ncbi:hypothetical protein, partial [Aeromonas bivalvium]|uniref:hypothetical protein n=1 Tax=Aeromonas bivalvium TaxID=440079 RepID=UPI001ADED21C
SPLVYPFMDQWLAESWLAQYLTEKNVFPSNIEHITMTDVLLIGDVHDRLCLWVQFESIFGVISV